VDRAAAGEEIIIAQAGKPKADIADDFDRPLAPELQNYFDRTRSMAIEPVPSLHATPP
jgi:hypothetical protein